VSNYHTAAHLDSGPVGSVIAGKLRKELRIWVELLVNVGLDDDMKTRNNSIDSVGRSPVLG